MACDDRNYEKGSEEKGGPLSEKKHHGVSYWKKRSCKHCVILSEVLQWTLYMNGCLLKVSAIRTLSLPL